MCSLFFLCALYLAYRIIKIIRTGHKTISGMLVYMNLTLLTQVVAYSVAAVQYQHLVYNSSEDSWHQIQFFHYIVYQLPVACF